MGRAEQACDRVKDKKRKTWKKIRKSKK